MYWACHCKLSLMQRPRKLTTHAPKSHQGPLGCNITKHCLVCRSDAGRPLFPGSSDLDQLHQIMCTTGICPSQKELIKGHAGLNRLTAGFPEEPLVSLNAR